MNRCEESLLALWDLALREGTVDECLRRAVEQLAARLDARRVTLYELAPERRPPQLRVLCDSAGAPEWRDVGEGAAASGWRDVGDVPAAAALLGERGAAPVAMRQYERATEATLAVVLGAQAQRLGALLIAAPPGFALSGDQRYFLECVARLLAGVLARRRSDELLLAATKMEALGQISGGIAHDFNNLLSVISTSLERLESRLPGGDPLHKLVQSAMRATQRGGELTHRLLLYARKGAPHATLQRLTETLPGLVELIARAVGERIEVRVESATDLPDVLVDPSVLDACVLNLATNARDAMPQGGTLTLRAELATLPARVAAAPDHLALSVGDTGTGMAADVAQRAFEPFFTTKEAGKGTGLGLSLVQTLMRQAGGDVSLRSSPAGTVATLYFPLHEAAPAAGA